MLKVIVPGAACIRQRDIRSRLCLCLLDIVMVAAGSNVEIVFDGTSCQRLGQASCVIVPQLQWLD